MKRKDYALLAKFIRGLRGYVKGIPSTQDEPFGRSVKELVFINLLRALKKDNANFNSDNFKKDCGL